MNNTSSKSTIKALQHCFTTHGYPQVIISDNGPVLTSDEFAFFVVKPLRWNTSNQPIFALQPTGVQKKQ